VPLRIIRDQDTIHLTPTRVAEPDARKRPTSWYTNDRPGETFQKLSPEVAYLKLSSVKSADAVKYVSAAADTKGLVIDIRNYPSESMVFALGSHLVDRTTPFALFTNGDAANPGAFRWTPPESLSPSRPRYTGKIAILIDELSQSQSEYTTMAFRAAANATVVGSTTAGADGNVSPIPLPGGLRSMISGIGVFYPDKKPTQRIGIIPDIEVRPTLRGIRSGRDEVLEAALRHILGADTPAAELERLAKQ
jgi:C-terminal processing protease CtpA/Prc